MILIRGNNSGGRARRVDCRRPDPGVPLEDVAWTWSSLGNRLIAVPERCARTLTLTEMTWMMYEYVKRRGPRLRTAWQAGRDAGNYLPFIRFDSTLFINLPSRLPSPIFPQLSPCLTLQEGPGPITLTPHESPTSTTFRRSRTLPDSSSAQCSTVRRSTQILPFIRAHRSRDRHRPLFPMHERFAQPCKRP